MASLTALLGLTKMEIYFWRAIAERKMLQLSQNHSTTSKIRNISNQCFCDTETEMEGVDRRLDFSLESNTCLWRMPFSDITPWLAWKGGSGRDFHYMFFRQISTELLLEIKFRKKPRQSAEVCGLVKRATVWTWIATTNGPSLLPTMFTEFQTIDSNTVPVAHFEIDIDGNSVPFTDFKTQRQ